MNAKNTVVRAQSDDVDPLGDAAALEAKQARKNYAKVGGARPSSLLYNNGPGAVVDLPHFTVMPTGLDDWKRIWERREGHVPTIHAPRLLDTARLWLGNQVTELRPFPHQQTESAFSDEGRDLGVPARIFPQWFRCTGCDRLAPLRDFHEGYSNTHKYRTDEAVIRHEGCTGRAARRGTSAPPARKPRRGRSAPLCVPARYLLVCPDGHADEFPYDWWVHEGARCTGGERPILEMTDSSMGRGASARIRCRSCSASRGMNEAQGETGRAKLPGCRGRLPHLGAFASRGCIKEARLMLVGASNLWFPILQSIVDMPRLNPEEQKRDDAARFRSELPADSLTQFGEQPEVLRVLMQMRPGIPARIKDLDDEHLIELAANAIADEQRDDGDRRSQQQTWDPTDLLVPEWRYLEQNPPEQRHEDPESGLVVSPRPLHNTAFDGGALSEVTRVLAVDRLRKVNVLLGFTRIDEIERVDDAATRRVPLTRSDRPRWLPATEDRGEGVFLELDEERVSAWEARVQSTDVWHAHVASHKRNYENRLSETASLESHLTRMAPPRYWLLHTIAHGLMRKMAVSSGYASASLSERIYAWPRTVDAETGAETRPPAAGLLIMTTASDSDGTLGGLVSLSEPRRLAAILQSALVGMTRCSSDPVCAQRTPQDPEDFLHGAACHCCTMASETSCERANRFLDRRFVVPLPGREANALAFFGDPRG